MSITTSKQASKDHRNSRSAPTKVIIITDNSELHVHSTKLLLQPSVWHCGPISHVIQCVAIHYISLVGIAYAHVHHRHLEAISQREDQKRKNPWGSVAVQRCSVTSEIHQLSLAAWIVLQPSDTNCLGVQGKAGKVAMKHHLSGAAWFTKGRQNHTEDIEKNHEENLGRSEFGLPLKPSIIFNHLHSISQKRQPSCPLQLWFLRAYLVPFDGNYVFRV